MDAASFNLPVRSVLSTADDIRKLYNALGLTYGTMTRSEPGGPAVTFKVLAPDDDTTKLVLLIAGAVAFKIDVQSPEFREILLKLIPRPQGRVLYFLTLLDAQKQ